MSTLEKLLQIQDILKPEINRQIQSYYTQYKNAKAELATLQLSDKYKSEKLKSLNTELEGNIRKYTKNILSHLEISKQSDNSATIANIVKHASILKELCPSNKSLNDLIATTKEYGGANSEGELAYLPQEYLDNMVKETANKIFLQMQDHANPEIGQDISELNELLAAEEESESKVEQKLALPNAELRNIYMEQKKVVGAYGTELTYESPIGIHWVYIAIIIILLFMLNAMYNTYQLPQSSRLEYCNREKIQNNELLI